MSSKFIYVVACVGISFLLRLNNIPLCVCATWCLSICCFYLLAIVNNAAVNTVYKHLFETLLSILLCTCSEVELLGHMVIPHLIFKGNFIPFSTVAAPFTFPAMHKDSVISTSSPTLVIFCCEDNSHNGYEVNSTIS